MFTVLYIDDDHHLLTAGKMFLEREGEFAVETAASGPAALRLLVNGHTFDAIVSDYQMPKMDGIGVLRKVRESAATVPFILFTGKGREDVAIQALNEGADYYLQKGGDPEALFAELTYKLRQAIGRRKAEEALEASEERYRAVVEDQTELICRFTPEGSITFANGAYCRYFGITKDDYLNQSPASYLLPEDRERMERHLAALTPANPVSMIEHRLRMPDGTIRWQRWNDRAIFGSSGRVAEYQSVGRDITGRKRMEENMVALHDLSVSLFKAHTLPEAFSLCLATAIRLAQMDCGAIFLANSKTRDLELVTADGLPPELVQEISRIPAGSDSAQIVYRKQPFYAATRDLTLVSRAAQRDGLLTIAAIPVVYHDEVIACLGISSRTTDTVPAESRTILELVATHIGNAIGRILSEEALRQSEEQYRVMIEHIPDGAFLSQDGIALFCNNALAALTGYAQEEIPGMSIPDLVTPEDRELVMERQQARLAGHNPPGTYEFRLLHRDGSTRIPVLLSAGTGMYRGRPAIIGTLHDLREERRREAVIEENAERLALAQRLARLGYLTIELRSGETSWSDGVFDLLRYSRADMPDTKSITGRICHPEDRERVTQWLGDCIQSDSDDIPGKEFRIIRSDGGVRDIYSTGVIQRDANGPVRIFLALQDITEQNESKRLLETLSSSLTDALIMAKMAAWDYDIASDTFVFNDAFYAMHDTNARLEGGYTMSAGTLAEKFITPPIRKEIFAVLDEAARSLDPDFEFTKECEVLRRDGSSFWVMIWFRIARDKTGKAVALHGVNQDITLQKHADLVVRENEKRLRKIYDSGLFGVVFWKPDGEITAANDRFLADLGYTREDLDAGLLNLYTLTPPEYAALDEASMAELKESGVHKKPIEKEYIRKDGSHMPVVVAGAMLDENRTEGVGFVLDITERKQNEETITNGNRQLNLLISVTRHDIKNQLLSLRALLELSKATLDDQEKTTGYIDREEQVTRSIERLISFTKEYQALGIRPPVWQHAGACVRAVAEGIDFGNVTLSVSDLDAIEILADPLLTKVFYNLFENTLRHAGESLSEIRVDAQDTGGGLLIRVGDNGCGIPDTEKEAIFGRGYGKNSGFGLFFAREILGITGIMITETGKQESGALFVLRVPGAAYRYCD